MWRPHGNVRVDRNNPQAQAVCDRCGFWFNHVALSWQFDYAGPRLQNKRLLVCSRCLDKPFEHYKPIVVPPDPLPIKNPRPERQFAVNPYNLNDTRGNPLFDSAGNPISAPPKPNLGHLTDTSGIYLRDTQGNPLYFPTGILQNPGSSYRLSAPNGGPVLFVPD